jgi:hypothetical protein
MKLPSGKTILIFAAVFGFMAVMFGIIVGVKKVVAAGFFAALFNLPGEGDVMLRMILLMATTASGAATFRLAIF